MGAQEFLPGSAREMGAAVKEVLENIIRHGYRTRPGEIKITCTTGLEKVTVEIADSAPGYNPLKAPGPDEAGTGLPGGLGIAFVLQVADIVTYRHKDHRNILTLVKVKRKEYPDPADR